MLPAELRQRLRDWQAADPDQATITALDHLIERSEGGDADAVAEIVDAFSGRLAFGTAGLRAALGPGPNRMNRVVVSQAAAGLARWLVDNGHAGRTVLVGYDARYNSDVFARDTAEILAGHGLRPLLTETHVPTPVVAFGIGHYDCVAGVVVTASHNPPQDNGYKVYVGPSQIVPPTDGEIAAQIETVAQLPLSSIARAENYETIGEPLLEAYVGRVASLVADDAPRDLAWVYTAMHGVGAEVVARVLDRTGFPAPALVDEQALPDPAFPTVAFPNPEEKGAMDLALALARTTDADVAIANDPDADRCALAAPFDGQWRMLSGDELGWLLADDALRRGTPGVYACSVVSSTLLGRMAAAAGQPFQMTLTGFKWIGRVPGLAFGYEEAIGYCTDPEGVADKDGISTLTRVLALVAALKAEGSTVQGRLDEIARTHGVHLTAPLSFRVSDLSLISDAMARLRADLPTELAGVPVTASDLGEGWNGLPPTDGVLFEGEGVRAVARPSGTEPKLKVYLQVSLPPERSGDLDAARAEAAAVMEQLKADMAAALGL
ncbi:phospho-sugar mutase [Propioniciclava sp. MC1595]|uniref:phospho-sugar mutase n=1 Tax=Propioniciclava sp. MC1595 TaxID=2760308 RepID=UPI001662766E|nr:phospho-sugar mutase [Propioniciclava sp. MC1595]MBB1494218.1 phospho-sugar mutase [Propioniciclava sp. MC1595]QTE25198.1 phospho-sugar mutase [Propioniciclava sp. MC1595]